MCGAGLEKSPQSVAPTPAMLQPFAIVTANTAVVAPPGLLDTGYGAWQAEMGEQASVSESSDRRNLLCAHGQDHDPAGSMDVRVRVWEVVAKGGLVVGSGGYELEVLTPDAPTVEVLGDDSRASELEWLGRHNELGVIAQHGDHSFEIALLE